MLGSSLNTHFDGRGIRGRPSGFVKPSPSYGRAIQCRRSGEYIVYRVPLTGITGFRCADVRVGTEKVTLPPTDP
ncbi:hypothetical protein RE2895_62000 (plasmid) [Rhodococcus erythropolis]|nr:hypothetical protein RE2895_62000 [Rhodococcus erythropolis]